MRGPDRRDSAITPPPTIAVDDAGTRHAAFLAPNDARNAANAARRAELAAQTRAIAGRAGLSATQSPTEEVTT
ncbi:hypothetical protein AB0392_55735 [Nonomuraea angiospora]|uniref:hypothetical protein n=1 Tax=Nonomuraea angiospora TaxID=46172 RepID=UPI00344B68FA